MSGFWSPIGAGVSIAGAVAMAIMAVQDRDFAYASGATAWFICCLFFAREGLADARAQDAARRTAAAEANSSADPVVPMVPAPGVPRRPPPRPADPEPQIPGPVAHDPDCCRPRRRRR